jgi:hypothetical protein
MPWPALRWQLWLIGQPQAGGACICALVRCRGGWLGCAGRGTRRRRRVQQPGAQGCNNHQQVCTPVVMMVQAGLQQQHEQKEAICNARDPRWMEAAR